MTLKKNHFSHGYRVLLILFCSDKAFKWSQRIGYFFTVGDEFGDRCVGGLGRCQFSQHRNIL
jgi:hypothetical protein